MYVVIHTYFSFSDDIEPTTKAWIGTVSGMRFDDVKSVEACAHFRTKKEARAALVYWFFHNGKIPKSFKIIKAEKFTAWTCA